MFGAALYTQTLEPRALLRARALPQPGPHPGLRHRARRLRLSAALHREPLHRRRPLRRRQPGDARDHLALPQGNGQERFRATLGQRYYFAEERVALAPASPLRRASPTCLASVGGRAHQALELRRHHPIQPATGAGRALRRCALRYTPEIAKVLNASYRFQRDSCVRSTLRASGRSAARLVRRRPLQLLVPRPAAPRGTGRRRIQRRLLGVPLGGAAPAGGGGGDVRRSSSSWSSPAWARSAPQMLTQLLRRTCPAIP